MGHVGQFCKAAGCHQGAPASLWGTIVAPDQLICTMPAWGPRGSGFESPQTCKNFLKPPFTLAFTKYWMGKGGDRPHYDLSGEARAGPGIPREDELYVQA